MEIENRRPAWWQLYLLGLVMIGLLTLGTIVPLSELGHQVALIGALLLVYGLVALWLRANTPALLDVSRRVQMQSLAQKVVLETPPLEPVLAHDRRPRTGGAPEPIG